MDSRSTGALAGTEPSYPFWTPDGRQIGFFAGGKLKRIPIAVGPAVSLAVLEFAMHSQEAVRPDDLAAARRPWSRASAARASARLASAFSEPLGEAAEATRGLCVRQLTADKPLPR